MAKVISVMFSLGLVVTHAGRIREGLKASSQVDLSTNEVVEVDELWHELSCVDSALCRVFDAGWKEWKKCKEPVTNDAEADRCSCTYLIPAEMALRAELLAECSPLDADDFVPLEDLTPKVQHCSSEGYSLEGTNPSSSGTDAASPDGADAASPDGADAASPDGADAASPDDTDAASPDDTDASSSKGTNNAAKRARRAARRAARKAAREARRANGERPVSVIAMQQSKAGSLLHSRVEGLCD